MVIGDFDRSFLFYFSFFTDSFSKPVLWTHICLLVLAIESSADPDLPSIYKKLPEVIQVLQPSCKMPTNMHRFLTRAKEKLEEAKQSAELDFLNAAVRELLPDQSIVSETCEAAKISVKWLLTEDTDHPQKPYQLTNAQAVDLYTFHKSKQQTLKQLQLWFTRIYGDEFRLGSLESSLRTLHTKKRKKKGQKLKEFLHQRYQTPPKSSTEQKPIKVLQPNGNVTVNQAGYQVQLEEALQDEMVAKEKCRTEALHLKQIIKGVKGAHVLEMQRAKAEQEITAQQLETVQAVKDSLEKENETLKAKYDASKHGHWSIKNVKKREATSKNNLTKKTQEIAVLKADKLQLQRQNDLAKENHEEELTKLQTRYEEEIVTKHEEEIRNLLKQKDDELFEAHVSAQCEIGALLNAVDEEKYKKRCAQKSRWHYKHGRNILKTRLQEMDDSNVKKLMNSDIIADLENENEELKEIINELKQTEEIQTFQNGRYSNAIRLVCYDLLTHGVSSRNIPHVIEAVVRHLTDKKLTDTPSPTSIKRMAYECNILAKRQTAEVMSQTENATLLYDGTSKHQKKFMLYQIATDKGILTASLDNILSGDTETQLESTKEFLATFSDILNESGTQASTESLLYAIKNTMSDRASVNKAYNSELQAWRESTLPSLLKNYNEMSPENREALAKVNDFFCGLHFECHMGESSEAALVKWERLASGCEDGTAMIGMASLAKFKYWNFTTSHTQRFIKSVCDTFSGGRHANEQVGIPETFRAYLNGKKMNLKDFVGNRFNILFENGAAVFHHRNDVRDVLEQVGKTNKMYDAIKADLDEEIIISATRALGIVHVHITAPLWRILANDETHVLDMSNYYTELEKKLNEWRDNPSELLDPSFVLYPNSPPKKDEVFTSLYDGLHEDSLVAEALSVICGSMHVITNRQLADHLPGGKYNQPDEGLREQTKSVPTTNIAPEHSFGHLDYLLRLKPNATIEHCGGIMAFKSNQTMKYMCDGKLDSMVSQAIPNARKLQTDGKRKKTVIRNAKLRLMQENAEKNQEKVDKERQKLAGLHNAVHAEGGLCKTRHDLIDLTKNLKTVKAKREALFRQIDYHKFILKTEVQDKKLYNRKDGKRDYTIDQLVEKVLKLNHIMETRTTTNVDKPATEGARVGPDSNSNIANSINQLKREMKRAAIEEREKALTAPPKRARLTFPSCSSLVGQRFKHRFTRGTQSRWFEGTIIRVANGEDMKQVNEDDSVHVGTETFFVCHYDDGEESVYPLFRDWKEKDIEFLS